ncbi:hypothetical protein ACH40E_33085 [Streptomyces acidicola]|uniref:hypothetical protein n=1 Tax=Streptomyces acidicola TaxID=2596892 RepID=UPI0037B4D716
MVTLLCKVMKTARSYYAGVAGRKAREARRRDDEALAHSDGARAHYDRRRAAGDRHTAAQRNLFNRMVGCLHHCLTRRVHYDESSAFPAPLDPQLHSAA